MCDPGTVITCSSTKQCRNSAPREPRSECFSKSEREPSVKGIAAISQAPAMMSLYKHHQRLCYYSIVAVSTRLTEEPSPSHINISINLLTISIWEPKVNKFLPIRSKLPQLCEWADEEEHNLKPMETQTVRNDQTMISLNQHGIIKKKLQCDGHKAKEERTDKDTHLCPTLNAS